MIDKKTVFVLGAGASCPYGYPSGVRLRERICLSQGFMNDYTGYGIPSQLEQTTREIKLQEIKKFKDAFNKSRIKSIDLFMAINPKLALIGKYIIAFEILRAELQSFFGEEAKLEQEMLSYRQGQGLHSPSDLLSQALFQGGDWYFYLYNRLIEGLVGKGALPDFSDGKIVFITFNYDRSLEHFLYESLCNSFTGVLDDRIVQYLKQTLPVHGQVQIAPQNRELLIQLVLKQLKILHVYGQIAPLKWQDPEQGVDYKTGIQELLLERAAANIKTIYEQKESPELNEARQLLEQAEQIFFLGFSYAPENMEVLGLPGIITPRNCRVYGTAFGMNDTEIDRIVGRIIKGLRGDQIGLKTEIKNTDCLELLRNHLE